MTTTLTPRHLHGLPTDSGDPATIHLSGHAWATHLTGWHVLYTWGDDGDELTDIDHFVVAIRTGPTGHHLATYTATHAIPPYIRPATDDHPAEIIPGHYVGRVHVDTYDSEEQLHEAVSGLAHAYWLRTGTGPAVLPVDVTDLPARYRRPHHVLAAA